MLSSLTHKILMNHQDFVTLPRMTAFSAVNTVVQEITIFFPPNQRPVAHLQLSNRSDQAAAGTCVISEGKRLSGSISGPELYYHWAYTSSRRCMCVTTSRTKKKLLPCCETKWRINTKHKSLFAVSQGVDPGKAYINKLCILSNNDAIKRWSQ